MSSTIGYLAGTPVSWTSTGVPPNKVIQLGNLVAPTAAQGDKSDAMLLGGQLPAFIRWKVSCAFVTGPFTGREVVLFVGQSDSPGDTNNPANLLGTNQLVANFIELFGQLDRVGSVLLSNARGSSTQTAWMTSYPKSPYQIPVLFNDAGQTFAAAGVAHNIIGTPYYQTIGMQ